MASSELVESVAPTRHHDGWNVLRSQQLDHRLPNPTQRARNEC